VSLGREALEHEPSLAAFMAGHQIINTGELEYLSECFGVIGLTNFGEWPVSVNRLAEVAKRPVPEVEDLARQMSWPPLQVENGLITVTPERDPVPPRRHLQIGDRRFGVSGCAPDVFLYAPLVRPSLRLQETCPATGTPIRVLFTPGGVEELDPDTAVLVLPGPHVYEPIKAMGLACDTNEPGGLCSQCPLYASEEAAQVWLADHPGSHLFPLRDAWDLPFYRNWRTRMSALLDLDHDQAPGSTPSAADRAPLGPDRASG
jgi:alkylmercury lyase